jgi:septum site-determining protein MinC
MDVNVEPTRQPIRFRGRSYVAFVFCPIVPIVNWLEVLDTTLVRSPGFFAGKPVVLDLSALELSAPAILHLVRSIEARGIRILGIEGVDAARLSPELPPLVTGGRHLALAQIEPKKAEAKPAATSLLLDSPVRSGQSIFFPDGDVTVLGAVSSGAEIVAGGSIHVYGALRGRAMAGVNGNASARIYCQKIEAELLAIDGYYHTAEQIDAALRGKPAQARLDGNALRITPLN